MSRQKEKEKLTHIPGDYGLPLIHNSISYYLDPLKFTKERVEKYGPIYKGCTYNRIAVAITHPDGAETVLMNQNNICSATQGWEPMLGSFFPNGLLMRDFTEHRAHRRLMQQALQYNVLTDYIETLNSEVRHFLVRLPKNTIISFYPNIKQYLLEVATKVFLGEEIGYKKSEKLNTHFMRCLHGTGTLIRYAIPGTTYYKGIKSRQFIVQYLSSRITQRRASSKKDMFSILCKAQDEEGNYFSDKDVVDHMAFMLFAAHDTLASQLTSMTYYLALYPEWQEKLREEFASFSDKLKGTPDLNTLSDLQVADWVLKESLRLMPPVFSYPRFTQKECQIMGYTIPKHIILGISPLYIQRHPEFWTNPDSFDPLRFAPERAEDKRHRFCWIPFGGGVHKCLGMHYAMTQIKILLYQLVSNFSIKIEPGYHANFKLIPMPKPKDGLKIKLVPLRSTMK